MTILITGACGMIGSHLRDVLLHAGYCTVGVDRRDDGFEHPNYTAVVLDLSNKSALQEVFLKHHITHVIHLAALAHTTGEKDLSYDTYYAANVENAMNVFECGKDGKVLFISTVDVFGFTKGIVNSESPISPVTAYGKTKALAEKKCKEICKCYNVYRFSPVYTDEIKRDIQKRYYLKYPKVAYQIGKGSYYEVLNINVAISAIADWIKTGSCDGSVKIIKDKKLLDTKKTIAEEKASGRARIVIKVPRLLVNLVYSLLRITGKNKFTYLLNKAVNPLRTE